MRRPANLTLAFTRTESGQSFTVPRRGRNVLQDYKVKRNVDDVFEDKLETDCFGDI